MVLHSTCGERRICMREEQAEKGQIKRKWSMLLLSYCTLRDSSSLVSPSDLINILINVEKDTSGV